MSEAAGRERVAGRGAIALAGLLGALGVILGALGAHGPVEVMVRENARLEQWETAVFYHLTHAIVLLVLPAVLPGRRGPWLCLLSGVAFFSGSLYVMALTGIGSLGAVTPVGGVLLIGGWLWVAFAALRLPR